MSLCWPKLSLLPRMAILMTRFGLEGIKTTRVLAISCTFGHPWVEWDLLLPGDHHAARVVRDIANTICEFTSFKVDLPSAHPSGLMPLLDI